MYIIPLFLLLAAALVLLRFFWVVGAKRRGVRPNPLGEEAAAVLEFTLVFPLFLMIILIIWQLLLLVNASQVVSYAAFSAARSAIVVIPMKLGSEGANQLLGEQSSQKMATIRQAAAIACTPISPPITEWAKSSGLLGGIGSLTGGLAGLSDTASLAVLVGSAGLNAGRAVQKSFYASQFTDVEIAGANERGAFVENAPITVKVAHKFFLNVPYANRLFSDSLFAGFGLGGFQRTLTAQYTLTNEGAKEVL